MLEVILKSFEHPDEVTHFEKGIFETVTVGGMTIGQATYEPGCKWSEHVGPQLDAEFCTVEHVGMVLSGVATAALADGTVTELRPGFLFYVPGEPHNFGLLATNPTFHSTFSAPGFMPGQKMMISR